MHFIHYHTIKFETRNRIQPQWCVPDGIPCNMVPEVSQADPYRWNSRDVASSAVADAVKILKGSTAGKLFAAF